MKESFVPKNFRSDSLVVIDKANEIIADYQAQGFTLTLRQLYYQFVSRDLIKNSQTEYKRLGSIINDARLAGLLDWSAIEDRGRSQHTHSSWSNPQGILNSAASWYAENPWLGQDYRPFLRIEKDALIGVVEPACNRWRIPFIGCRGYTSQTEAYEAGKLFGRLIRRGVTPVVIYLGDHDPSGVDMTRDNEERLSMFAREGVEVRRIALNWDQIEEYGPPPNPAKETDSRSGPYIDQFGESSWELDALEPTVIDSLIDDVVSELVDQDAWDESIAAEDEGRRSIELVASRWEDIQTYLEQNP